MLEAQFVLFWNLEWVLYLFNLLPSFYHPHSDNRTTSSADNLQDNNKHNYWELNIITCYYRKNQTAVRLTTGTILLKPLSYLVKLAVVDSPWHRVVVAHHSILYLWLHNHKRQLQTSKQFSWYKHPAVGWAKSLCGLIADQTFIKDIIAFLCLIWQKVLR